MADLMDEFSWRREKWASTVDVNVKWKTWNIVPTVDDRLMHLGVAWDEYIGEYTS